jgi:hypothetical protein
MKQNVRPQYLIAKDLADRLLPNRNMNELLLWPPNLFAFTSYVLTMTGAYQLVVSPPADKRWPPMDSSIKEWLNPARARKNMTKLLESSFKYWSLEGPEHHERIASIVDRMMQDSKVSGRLRHGIEATNRVFTDEHRDNTWYRLVDEVSADWRSLLSDLDRPSFNLIKDQSTTGDRSKRILDILLRRTPPALFACWSFFLRKVEIDRPFPISSPSGKTRSQMAISELLCNQTRGTGEYDDTAWLIAQALITLHAIADETCIGWGLVSVETAKYREGSEPGVRGRKVARRPKHSSQRAQFLAEERLTREGTLATIHPERCRVLPKRHNPSLGITLRSLSSNLAFHRSAVEVVWRNSRTNPLAKRLTFERGARGQILRPPSNEDDKTYLSMLLLPFPLDTRTRDFQPTSKLDSRVTLVNNHKFFEYKPESKVNISTITHLIRKAAGDVGGGSVDMIVMPESSLDEAAIMSLEETLVRGDFPTPSVYVIGVSETPKAHPERKFTRNAVYCKYFDEEVDQNYGSRDRWDKIEGQGGVPKFKQYKHHRWRLNYSQIRQYGLSRVLEPSTVWWEAIKVPRRRVSFLNVGDKLTLCHLICEDLARQDPIADLIRHIGPSLVVTILLDGPQRADRWSSKYASVLSEDPGCSVITLTAFGMVRRWNSPFRGTSRVVALWSEKDSVCREIELEEGAEAVLLTMVVDQTSEVTADGRRESKIHETSVFRLVDVIQIYPGD